MSTDNLIKLENSKKIYSHLKKTKNQSLVVTAWKIIGNEKILIDGKISLVKIGANEFHFNPEKIEYQKLKQLSQAHHVIEFFVPELGLLFRSKYKSDQKNNISLSYELPMAAAMIEKRNLPRASRELSMEIKLMLNLPSKINKFPLKINKSFLDISSGGISFLLSKQELIYFKNDQEILGCMITLGEFKIPCSLKVLSVQEIEPSFEGDINYRSWRVGCRFMDISLDDKRIITGLILGQLNNKLHAIVK